MAQAIGREACSVGCHQGLAAVFDVSRNVRWGRTTTPPIWARPLGRGLISMETIDEIVRRILTEKIRMGLFERPAVDEGAIALQTPDAVELAREVARQ